MDGLYGFVQLGDDLPVTFETRSGNTPTEASAGPTYRVYDPDGGLMNNGTGSADYKDSAAISGATNANPIVITSTGHGLTNGTRVTISGVLGNTAANTTATVANKTTDTFELSGVSGNGSYSGGGTWRVTGLYTFTVTASAGNNYEAGKVYTVRISATVSSAAWSRTYSFIVT